MAFLVLSSEERDDVNLEFGSWKQPKTRHQEAGNFVLVLAGPCGPEKILPCFSSVTHLQRARLPGS